MIETEAIRIIDDSLIFVSSYKEGQSRYLTGICSVPVRLQADDRNQFFSII